MLNYESLKNLVILFVITFVLSYVASAQSTTATLSGSVSDEKDAAVPGATVRIINTDAGFERTVTTNNDGVFVIALLPPATYQLTVERSGFAPFEVTQLILNANDQKSLNLRLRVGQVGAQIEVNAEGNLIDDSAAVSTTIDRTFVANLPLNGRSLQGLISLSPGVVVTPSTSSSPGQFSVNGQRTGSNYFTIDGISANFGANNFAGSGPTLSGQAPATNIQGSFSNLASLDAIQEFKIQTSTFAAEFGRSPGANVSILTRSGGNIYRGSLYEYVRNDVFDATDFFTNLAGFEKPALRYNNFGGTIGGPVILPRFGEGGPALWKGTDKTFFFFSYEGQRFVLPRGAVSSVVPSLSTRTNAPNQTVRDIVSAFPLPNGAEITSSPGVLTGGAILTSSYSEPSAADNFSIKLDHNLTKKVTLFGYYANGNSTTQARSVSNLSIYNDLGLKSRLLTLGSTQIFTSRLVNEFRLNLSRNEGTTQNIFDGFGGGIAPPDYIFYPSNAPGTSRRATLTLLGFNGTSGLGFTFFTLGTPAFNRQRQFQVIDNLSYTAGAHQLKFGADFRRLTPIVAPNDFISGTTINGLTNLYNLRGNTSGSTSLSYTLLFPSYSFYGQDTWKVNSRLTLTYGLRWEINPAPTGTGGIDILTLAELRDPDAIDFSYLQLAPAGKRIYPTRYGNFAPRFGAAYQLIQKEGLELVIRGGAGIFYDTAQNGFGAIGFPYNRTISATNTALPITPSFANFPEPNFNLSPTNRASVTTAINGYNLPKVYQFNLTAEQSLGKNQTISAGYVGAVGRGLLKSSNITLATAANAANPNQPFSPNFSSINILLNGSESDYHSMQLQFIRRLTRGFQANLGYTWSHSIDTGSDDSERIPLSRVSDVSTNRGNSSFDVRHALTGGFTYQIPALKSNKITQAVLGGWSLNSIFFARSGLPFNIVGEQAQSSSLFGSSYTRRPNLIASVPIWIDDSTIPGGRRLNPAAFSFPTPTQSQGTFGRNVLRGPGAWQIDMGLHRRFALTERVGLQLRWEVFNVFNHTNFANPTGSQLFLPGNATTRIVDTTNRTFGTVSSVLGRGLGGGGNEGGFNPIFQVGSPRAMQFALRLEF